MQSVIITGASSGIGAALGRLYAKRGATLGLIARGASGLERLAADLRCNCATYPLDVRDAAALQAAGDDFISRFGCPDVVIANAGISVGTSSAFAEDVATFEEVLDTNLTGMVKTFQPFVSSMLARGSGALVGIASVAGYRGLPGAGAYSASKAGVISYLESLRVELAGSGVRVVTICPGYVETPMTGVNPYPMPFLLKPDQAANKIVSAIERGKSLAIIPWQMAIIARLLTLLPNLIYDALFKRAPHKPRRPN